MRIQKYDQFILEHNDKINEELGLKDILMGVALFAGTLSSTQQIKAQEIVKDKGDKISTFLSQESEDTIIKKLQDAGYTKAASKLSDNQVNYKDLINKIGKKENGVIYSKETSKSTSIESLKNKILSGFAVTGYEKKVIRDTLIEYEVPTITYDTITMQIDNQQLFESGSFKISDKSIQSITDSLQKFKNDGLLITKVTVESSTDKQQLTDNLKNILKSKNYSSDNNGLSNARNDSFSKVIKDVVGDVEIKKEIKSEQGTSEVEQSSRYVKATFVCIHINKEKSANPKVTIKEEIKYIFNVEKVVKGYDGYKPSISNSKISGNSGTAHGNQIMGCPVFK